MPQPKVKPKENSRKNNAVANKMTVFSKPGSGNGGQKPPKHDRLPKKGT